MFRPLNKKTKISLPKVSIDKYERHYSIGRMLAFAFIFGLIGAYFIWHSLAATQLVAMREAEQMSLPASAIIYNDSGASNGKAVRFNGNATATGTVTIPSGNTATTVTVKAHGNSCHGWSTLSLTADGHSVLSSVAASSSTWSTYSATLNLSSGTHSLSLTAGNVGSKGHCSRYLYADVINFYGSAAVTSAPTLAFNASPTSVASGSGSTLTWTTTQATSCNASGAWSGAEPTAGSVTTGSLTSSKTYSLSCTGSGGTANASVTVSVTGSTPSPGTILWSGDFETGTLSQWSMNQSCPNAVSITASPLRSGKYAAAFTVTDQSTQANCPYVPTSDPRAQLVGPPQFTNGNDDYVGFSTYFPANFPTITSWFQFAEIYGPPYGGSPPMGFDVSGNRLVMKRDPTHNWDTIWTSPTDITKGTGWEDIIVHVKFSTDPSVGFIELWLNGVPQKFTNGSTRIYYDTLVPGVNWDGSSPNRLYLNQYRSTAPLGSVTIWHDAARVGTSYASVAP